MPTTSAPAAITAPAVSATLGTPAAGTRGRSARVNRRPHPNLAALKVRAIAITCRGLHSPAIALLLSVPERTIRRWINDTLLSLAQDALDPNCDSAASETSAASDASAKPNNRDDSDHACAARNATDTS